MKFLIVLIECIFFDCKSHCKVTSEVVIVEVFQLLMT